MQLLSKRNKQRILRHHLPLAFLCGFVFLILYFVIQSEDVKFRASLATGYVGMALLTATLMSGAWNVLRRRRNPVSTDLRRDIGIWCGLVSLAHVVIGLQVHMNSMLLYFFRETGTENKLLPRADLFGFANYAGLIAVFLTLLLLSLSNDVSLRRLGSRRWKLLQRSNYALIVLVVIHSLGYQIIEKRQLGYLLFFWLMAGAMLVLQLLGFRRRRRNETRVT
jgi:methionine sulfoxide reductase heme-binding subunit